MLATSGELGYRRATVRQVLRRSGGHTHHFYSQFRNRDECFAAAYELEADRICALLLEVGARGSSWSEGLAAALARLFAYVNCKPLLAHAVFAEVYVAGGAALAKHEEVLERLAGAIDSAHRGKAGSLYSPPPTTGSFVVGAVAGIVRTKLAAGEVDQLPDVLPELMQVITALYRD